MALGTHPVPVLTGIGPVQPVFGIDGGIRIQVIPFPFFHIPGDGQALQSAAGKRYQILLQGIPSERMGDFKLVHLAGRALGVYEKFAALAIKAAGDTAKL